MFSYIDHLFEMQSRVERRVADLSGRLPSSIQLQRDRCIALLDKEFGEVEAALHFHWEGQQLLACTASNESGRSTIDTGNFCPQNFLQHNS